MKERALIGIDPDCDKSGIAVYFPASKRLASLKCLDLLDLMAELKDLSVQYNIAVHLEAGWLIKGTWHKGGHGQAKRVGANHELGRQIEKYLIAKNINYRMIKPAGYSSWKHDHFCKITGWPVKEKTNPETRVAAMMVFGY